MAESAKVGSSVLVGLMAFMAVSAWVAMEVIPDALDNPVRVFERVPTQARLFPASESLSPRESIVTPATLDAAPSADDTGVAAPAVVDAPREPTAPRAIRRAVARTAPPPEKRSVSRALIADSRPSQPAIAASRAAILVEERRRTLDERIEMQVMDRLASNPWLSGRIGVESRGAVVRLTGWTRTVGQARRAERDARSVRSVRYVRNEIRARVGGSV